MKILGIIPARGGSKGVHRKNIKLLAGKPLLAYTAEVALLCNKIDTVVLSSDDDEIIEIAEKMGVKAPFKRPAELSQDDVPTLPVIQHLLDFYRGNNEEFDAICLLQPTSPMRTLTDLNAAIDKFIASNCESLLSVIPVPHEYNPHWTFEPDDKGLLHIATGESEIITRRQSLPQAFIRDGSIYLTRSNTIFNGSLYGKTIAYYQMKTSQSINIDTPEDWKRAEELLKESLNKS